MRTIAITLATCLVALTGSGAMSAERTLGNAAAGGVLSSGGNVLATSGAGINTANQAAPVSGGYSPLSAAECEGLGGKVTFNFACAEKGHFACITVDPNGVVRKVCLTK
jgi:hypothetical protein